MVYSKYVAYKKETSLRLWNLTVQNTQYKYPLSLKSFEKKNKGQNVGNV